MNTVHTALRMFTLAGLLASGLASADTVTLTTVAEIKAGSTTSSLTSSAKASFNPGANLITFKVGNKTCTFNSSGKPGGSGGGAGCNYGLTYNVSTGALSSPWSTEKGCTPAAQMVAVCK